MSITNGTNITSIEKPAVGIDTGPGWATALNNSLDAIDAHDHTSNKGSRITPAALNINADLEFNENQLTEVKGVVLSQDNASSTNAAVYSTSGNLYWRNASGVAVQITDGSGVKSGAGSIDNMGSDAGNQAGASYSDTSKGFSFFTDQGSSDMGKMNHADLNLYKFSDNNSADTDYITLKASSSISGAGGTITVPGETGTMLTTVTSFAGAINIDATGGSGSITLDANTSVSIEADTTITFDAEGDINLDSNSGVLTFKDNGTAIGKISNSSSDLVIENEVDAKDIIFRQYDGNEVVRMAHDRRLYFFDKGGEYIYGDGSTLYIIAGSSVNFSSGTLSSINDLNTDAISVDDAAVGLNVDFSGGNNTTSKITLKDNVADALNITEGSNSYIKFVTTDSSEQIVFGKNSTFAGTTIADLGTVTTADINGGTIDGTNVNVSAVTLTTSTAQKEAIVDGGKGNLTKSDVGLSNVTNDAQVPASGGTFSGNVSFGDNNITNVGDIAVDTISSDAGTSIGVTLGTDSGDDFNVGSGKLVVEGDTGEVTIANKLNCSAGNSLTLQSPSGGAVVFNSGGANERMRITSAGVVNIANSSFDPGAENISLKAATTGGQIAISTGGLVWSFFGANADVQTNSSGQLITTSDKNKKKDLGKIESGQGLNTITQMVAHRYNFLSDLEAGIDIPTIGFFAQDLHAINPEIGLKQTKEIDGKEEELWGVNSKGILAYMVEAIKELSAKVNALEGA